MRKSNEDAIEQKIKELCEQENYQLAVAYALESYGHELLGYLYNELGKDQSTEDIFSECKQNILTGIKQFRGESSFRTWAFTVLRNTIFRHKKETRRRRLYLVGNDTTQSSTDSTPRAKLKEKEKRPLSQIPQDATSPSSYVRKKDQWEKFSGLLQKLSKTDQNLIFLHIEQEMTFEEIARSMNEKGYQKITGAALRKRFERIQKKLIEMAEVEGLR